MKKYWKIKTNDILGYSKIAFVSGVITTTCSHPFWVVNAKMTIQKVKFLILLDFKFLKKKLGKSRVFPNIGENSGK